MKVGDTMADYKTFTLRLNYDDPEHDKIIAAFDGLDKSRFSTKTKFIICALNHYIDYLNMSDAEELFKDRLRRIEDLFVMRKEFESQISVLKAEIKAELYADIVSFAEKSQYTNRKLNTDSSEVKSNNLH